MTKDRQTRAPRNRTLTLTDIERPQYESRLLRLRQFDGSRAVISEVRFVPIEFLGWDCLTIGALGWGQIQIANSNYITLKPQYSRKAWMLEMCDALLQFYPKEIAKIGKRISRFEQVKDLWTKKADVWAAKPVEKPKTIKTSGDDATS